MSSRAAQNDPAPAAPDPDHTADHSAVLAGVRVRAAIFLRAEYTEDWGFESVPVEDLASAFVPGATRVTLFHVVAAGRCWVEADGERHWAVAGDVIVLPYGDRHRMGGTGDTELVAAGTLLPSLPPWQEMPVIRHGAGGEETDIVCGYLSSDDPLFDPRLRALPPVFVVHPSTPTLHAFVQANIDYALQQTARVADDRFEVPPQVPELLLVEVLRAHLASAPASERGLLRALRDPVLAPALAAIHGEPAAKWTVPALAHAALVSPSLLDQRFREVLGMPPIRYLTEWRMHVARGLLGTADLGVAAVARRVGYESEEAFSRAFKRAHGVAPSRWRASGAPG
jgi:AraC-like DNA-binding protein